jgi:hypothetical protein
MRMIMRQIHTEIEIDATPEEIRGVLTDFDRYPEWKSFIFETMNRKLKERVEGR